MGRTDLQEFFLKSLRERCGAPLVVFEPFGQRRLEQFAAELITGQPNRLEHRQHLGWWVDDFRSRAGWWLAGNRTVQKPQGGFAMISAGGAKLVENARLVRSSGSLVTAVNAGQGLALGR